MNIRTYQADDEQAQVEIYNEATAGLPKFKAATVEETARRFRAPGFDPGTRFYAEENGRVIGYAAFHLNGRVNYPWCRRGQESAAEPLFEKVLQTMRERGLRLAFAAYRGDWPVVHEFFLQHGFRIAREMVNFSLDLVEMPTRVAQPSAVISSLRREDVPVILDLSPETLRVHTVVELERHFFHNPDFSPESVLVIRGRKDGSPVAVGVVLLNDTWADPKQVDANMPCFRLGAFGAEGMQTKRVNGLFSFLAKNDADMTSLGMSLLEHAAFRLENAGLATIAAQVPSDAPHLLRFYRQQFRRQGSFPVFETVL